MTAGGGENGTNKTGKVKRAWDQLSFVPKTSEQMSYKKLVVPTFCR